MHKRLQKLIGQRTATVAAMRAMLDLTEKESRELTAEESATYAAHEATLATVSASITREENLAAAEKLAAAVATPGVVLGHQRETDAPWSGLGDQLKAIADVGMGASPDPRLFKASASGASANVGPDGGFLIEKQYDVDLTSKGIAAGALASRCTSTEIGVNADSLEVVTIDETSRATGSRWGGVRVYRRAEAETVTAAKLKFGKWESRLEDMMGIAYATNRALQDASSLGAVYTEAFTEEFAFKIDDEIFRGTGVGQCLGVLPNDAAAGPTISVEKEVGQDAATIVAENIEKIWSHVPLKSRLRGVWVYNVDCEQQLGSLQIGTGVSGQLVMMPPGGLSGNPYATIKSRPAFPIEHANALGSVGDIAYLDLAEYKLITKGGVQQDESMHVRFLQAEMAFRWTKRINGAPKWRTSLAPYKGSTTTSPFVVLAAR